MDKRTKYGSVTKKLLLLILPGILVPALFLSIYFSWSSNGLKRAAQDTVNKQLRTELDKQIQYAANVMVAGLQSLYDNRSDKLSETETVDMIKKAARTAHYGENGFFWLLQYDGTRLVAPDDISQEGTNAWNLTDEKGVKVIRELIKSARGGGGFITCTWKNPATNQPEPKRFYAAPLKIGNFEAVLATGTYLSLIGNANEEVASSIGAAGFHAALAGQIVAFLLLILVVFVLNLYIRRKVARPITVVAENIQQMVEGDLTAAATVTEKDEIGMISAELNKMKETLSTLISKVLAASEQVETISREIAAGNQNLSQRTQEQASTLEEISATMEEINSTVHLSAEHSKEADAMSLSTLKAVKAGENSIKETNLAMREISDGSKQIVEIIKVVNDIAFQTNLLALNAAVEAARAGEHGRGFAVVAAEVRNLAGRTAESSKQIEQLISESVKRIEKGDYLARQSTDILQQIVENTKRTSDAISEVASAANEQSAAINQIQISIQQLNQVTQQNAAMVQEIVASSHFLNMEAKNLSEMVSHFKVDRPKEGPRMHPADLVMSNLDFKQNPERHTVTSKDEFLGDGWEKF